MTTETPFKIKPKNNQTFFQRLIGRFPKENAIVEINNLLAMSQSIQDISFEGIQSVANTYKVNLNKQFQDELEILYRDYIRYCLSDKVITDEEVGDISHLKSILG